MIWIDYIIIATILLSSVLSALKGFTREILSLITLGFAFFITIHYQYDFLSWIVRLYDDNLISRLSSICIPFIAVIIIGKMLIYVLDILVTKIGLSDINRILGVLFGVLRGILIITLIVYVLNIFTDLPNSLDWKKSQLIPFINDIINCILNYIKNTRLLL
ncbi:MAG: colicin V production protein [Pantoea sp. Brub]|nr:colicin V production protein [Pantoea sp. Brub]